MYLDYVIQRFDLDWDSIVTDVILTASFAILTCVLFYFQKASSVVIKYLWWHVRRTYKKIRRFRFSQCFPAHTLAYIRLKRQSRQLELYKRKEKEQDDELEKDLITLIVWSSKYRYFAKDDALKAMSWQRPYTPHDFWIGYKKRIH